MLQNMSCSPAASACLRQSRGKLHNISRRFRTRLPRTPLNGGEAHLWSTAFRAAFVPTATNAGVSTTPFGVCSLPTLALEILLSWTISKRKKALASAEGGGRSSGVGASRMPSQSARAPLDDAAADDAMRRSAAALMPRRTARARARAMAARLPSWQRADQHRWPESRRWSVQREPGHDKSEQC